VSATVHHHSLDRNEASHRFIDSGFQVDTAASAITDVGTNDHFRFAIFDTRAQGRSRKTSVNHSVNGANARAGQHGNREFGRKRHIKRDAVACSNAKFL
jgi:hypothetical protein